MSQALETLTEEQKAAIRGYIGAGDPESFAALVAEQVELADAHATDAEIAAAIALSAAESSDYRTQAPLVFLSEIGAAAAGDENVSMFFTHDSAAYTFRTTGFEAGPTTISTITPLRGPVLTAAIAESYHSSRQARLLDNGVQPNLGITSAVQAFIDNSAVFSIDLVFAMPEVVKEYASKAAMEAAIGTGDDAPLASVVHTTETTTPINDTGGYDQPPIDVINSMDGNYLFNHGYWGRAYNSYNVFGRYGSNLFVANNNALGGNARLEARIDSRGLANGYFYKNTGGGVPMRSRVDLFSDLPAGSLHHVQFHACDGTLTLVINGVEVSQTYFTPATIAFIVDIFTMAGPHSVAGIFVTNGGDYSNHRRVHDVISRHYGTPALEWTDTVDLIVHQDQSRTSASPGSTAGDPNRPDAISGWNGELTGRSGADLKRLNPTQDATPGLYCASAISDAANNPAPFNINGFAYGNPNGPTQSGSGTETIEAGIWAQYRKWGGKNHLLIIGNTIGAYNHDQLEARSGKFLHSLPSYTHAQLSVRDWLNRAVLVAREWARRRGQRLRLVAVSDLQAETDAGTVGISTVRENDLRSWFTNELSKMVDFNSPPPIFLVKTPSYSSDGLGNGSNTAAVEWRDDKQRRIGLNRDTTFRFRPLTSIYAHQGRFIHWTALAQRKLGEAMGDAIFRARFYADDEPLQVVTAVRSGANIVLTTNKPVQIVAEMIPTVLGVHQTGGFDTYGLVYTPVGGVKAINGNVTLDGTGQIITVPISGGGPDAGDYIDVTGTNARWSNFKAVEVRTGEYPDQEWPAIPFASAAPTLDDTGGPNDISEWLSPSHHVLA